MYPTSVTNGGAHAVKVTFYAGTTDQSTKIADAPIIFVSNNQINTIVPAAVASHTADGVNIQVSVNAITNDVNNPFTMTVAPAVPGVFTPTGSGRGAAAVLNSDWSLNSSNATAAAHGTGIHIYATGLGVPGAGTTDTYNASPAAYPGNCVSTAGYLGILTGGLPPLTPGGSVAGAALGAAADPAVLLSIDGAVMRSAYLYGNLLPPCFATATSAGVQVKFGTSTTAIAPTYAGFVSDSVAGLYQIDVTLPATFTPAAVSSGGPMAMTIYVNGVASQTGVNVYVK